MNWENQQEYSWGCVGQIIAHQDKISAVTFDECACLRVVSCGFDGLVRRWKYFSQEWMLETEFNIQEVRGNINPTAVSCFSCSANESYNFVGTDRGWLFVWVVDCETNKSYYVSKKFENDSVVMCAWEKCAIVQSISRVAVGYKKGIVCVYSFIPSDISSTPSIVQLTRFYAHEADICHIVWRSSASASSSDPEILTCGRDQMVKVWNVTTSECTSSFQVPGQLRQQFGNAGRHNEKSEQNGAPWISACYTPGSDSSVNVLFSSVRGGLFHWDCKGTPSCMSLDSQGHSMLIFSMHYFLNSPGLVITLSQDRFLIVWQLVEGSKLSVILKVPTMSAGVCSLAQSEFSNGPLVAGLSDGSMIFWKFPAPELFGERNSSDNQKKEKFVSISPRGCKSSSVTTLSCHPLPQFENVIAYGTESGCVEIVDINKLRRMKSQKPKPQLYAFGSTVYRVTWGPLLFSDIYRRKANKSEERTSEINHSKSDNSSISTTHIIAQEDESSTEDNEASSKFSFYVYSISKGKIYCHFGCSRPPIDVSTKFPRFPGTTDEDWKALIRSEISFRLVSKSELPGVDLIADTFNCLVAVGYRSGEVDIYGFLRSNSSNCEEEVVEKESRRLVFICRTVNHSKCVNCLTWSRDHYWLAVGSNETFITVTDVKIQLINYLHQGESSKPIQLSTSLARLEGHYNRITCLDWSPHDPFLLLSASFDGTANVWRIHPENIEKDNFSISNFRALRSRHFACLWSRQEPDLAFSGGELCHLFGWQPSEQLFSQPPHTRRYRPSTVKKLVNDREAPSNGDILCCDPVPTETESLPDSKALNDKELKQKQVIIKSNDILPNGTSHQEMSIPLQCNSSRKVNSTGIHDKRKRPALFPNLFSSMNTNNCELDLDNSPPIQLGSFLSQILNASNFITEQMNDKQVEIDLLLLLPQARMTRTCLLKYLNMEASAHLESFHSQQRPNSLVHLDAYCIILLWIGHVVTVASIMSSEGHMPFWLLYAVQLSFSSDGSSGSGEWDLLGEKIKDMQTTSPDTLVSATLLVCAHRIHEAIELLLSYDKVKEALILAHLRLESSSEVVIYTEKCIKRLIDRRSNSVEKSFFSIILNIGNKQWISATNMLHREAGISKIRPGKEIEQLAWCWIGVNLLLNASSSSSSNDNDYLSNECLRLSSMCLTVSFRLFPKEPLFLNRWYEAFSRLLSSSSSETTPCPGVICSLMLLNIGQIIYFYMASYKEEKEKEEEEEAAALVVNGEEKEEEVVVYECLKNDWMKSITSDCLTYFSQLIADRQPSSLWEVCLTHFCIDFLLFYLIHNHCTLNKLVQVDTLTAYIDRYEASRKSCEYIKPKVTSYLIRHLFSTYRKILITNGLNTD
ncbi:unnamed protein product [Trichobilharzia szidati]|nr:unnamed protein product [Trichobilharzia szidati]